MYDNQIGTTLLEEGWERVGRFSEISPNDEIQRQFLEAIPDLVEKRTTATGTEVVSEVPFVGTIVDIIFIPDNTTRSYSDGELLVKRPQSR